MGKILTSNRRRWNQSNIKGEEASGEKKSNSFVTLKTRVADLPLFLYFSLSDSGMWFQSGDWDFGYPSNAKMKRGKSASTMIIDPPTFKEEKNENKNI